MNHLERVDGGKNISLVGPAQKIRDWILGIVGGVYEKPYNNNVTRRTNNRPPNSRPSTIGIKAVGTGLQQVHGNRKNTLETPQRRVERVVSDRIGDRLNEAQTLRELIRTLLLTISIIKDECKLGDEDSFLSDAFSYMIIQLKPLSENNEDIPDIDNPEVYDLLKLERDKEGKGFIIVDELTEMQKLFFVGSSKEIRISDKDGSLVNLRIFLPSLQLETPKKILDRVLEVFYKKLKSILLLEDKKNKIESLTTTVLAGDKLKNLLWFLNNLDKLGRGKETVLLSFGGFYDLEQIHLSPGVFRQVAVIERELNALTYGEETNKNQLIETPIDRQTLIENGTQAKETFYMRIRAFLKEQNIMAEFIVDTAGGDFTKGIPPGILILLTTDNYACIKTLLEAFLLTFTIPIRFNENFSCRS